MSGVFAMVFASACSLQPLTPEASQTSHELGWCVFFASMKATPMRSLQSLARLHLTSSLALALAPARVSPPPPQAGLLTANIKARACCRRFDLGAGATAPLVSAHVGRCFLKCFIPWRASPEHPNASDSVSNRRRVGLWRSVFHLWS
eukprot:TRINITY_DN76_c1_g2_i1.p2 TRINITY_DN76_c1_g2~~TRINITY_DN76_c1_g2_i1.p2  ORF type:complete len:147 (-),score=2.69 TRINITY_DN76_c1_g2_i1:68-508(-)